MRDDHHIPGDPEITGHALRYLTEDAECMVLILDHEETIMYANRYAEAVTGIPLSGRHLQTLLLFGSAGNTDTRSVLDKWRNESPPHLMNIRTADGRPLSFQIHLYHTRRCHLIFGQKDSTGPEVLNREILGLNQELTTITRELNQKNAELAGLNEMKNQFLGMAAHDLRNPVTIILLSIDLLLDSVPDDDHSDEAQMLRGIRRAAAQMSQVINDFLDVSIIESGQLRLNIREVDIPDMLEHVQQNLHPAAKKGDVTMDIVLDPAIESLRIDGGKIEQVLTNLGSNAIEHSPSGERVIIRGLHGKEEIRFQVEDSGAGISPEMQRELFSPFSGSRRSKRGGERSIGLGLVISRKIVEAHGGAMYVESEPDIGSTIGFTLPYSVLTNSQDNSQDT
ncbi:MULTISPECIES: sensor histidine kinase KdpD [Methanocalculus]|uniref:sensor histidine kinase n=1 Tax=Methanocalculus TaxID=71151 RepID=UPI00209CD483|nr:MULTISPECIES: HAMP domain-containing sensor histidine kinase [unclassified Methanocalculus]MCP1661412.1 signal transduction histidine kinase [Methanocalculus sp. AMF5]